MQYSTLRPGLLVSLKTSCRGNVAYHTVDLESGEALAKWETTRTVADPVEYEAAKRAREKAGFVIRRVCAHSAFGLLCPESDADLLAKAIDEARGIVDEFNAGAELTRIGLYVIAGRIAQDDVEAVRAINAEVRELMDDMADGLKRLDAKAVRDAASRVRKVAQMLTPDAAARVQIAIDSARAAATQIVKAGEAAAVEVDQLAIRRITEQRTAFLDLDGEDIQVARPTTVARTVDLDTAPV